MIARVLVLVALLAANLAHAASPAPADMAARDPALASVLAKMDAVSRNNVIAAWEQTRGNDAARDAIAKAMHEWRNRTKTFRTATTVPATIAGGLSAALGAKAAAALALGSAMTGGLVAVAAIAGVAAVYAADHYGRKMPNANEALRKEIARIGDAARAQQRALTGTGDGSAPARPTSSGTGNGSAAPRPTTGGTGNGNTPAPQLPSGGGTGDGSAPANPGPSGTGGGNGGASAARSDDPSMDGVERVR